MKQSSITVMHLIADLGYAGAQEVVRILVKELVGSDVRPLVVTFRDGPLRQDIEALGIIVIVLQPRQHKSINLLGYLSDMSRIRREISAIVDAESVDIIQTHLLGVLDNLVVRLKADHPKLRVLLTVHNVEFLPKARESFLGIRSIVRQWIFRRTARKCDGLIAVSAEVSDALAGEGLRDRVTTIQNGIDVSRFEGEVVDMGPPEIAGVGPGDFVIPIVGRLHEQKGHVYLIEAAKTVCEKHPDTRFLLIGDGHLRESLVAQVNAAGLSENVLFLGLRSDVPRILVHAGLFALPSLWEGLSIALLEAMAAGLAVIGTRVSGTNEVMIENETGLLVPAADSNALAGALCSLIDDREKSARMGHAGKQRVIEFFSSQKQVLEHIELYRSVI